MASPDILPRALQEMAQDLSRRHISRRMEVDLDTAMEQATSSYSFVREQGFWQAAEVLAKVSRMSWKKHVLHRLLDSRHSQLVDLAVGSLVTFDKETDVGAVLTSVGGMALGEAEAAVTALQGLSLLHKGSRRLMAARGLSSLLLDVLPRLTTDGQSSVLDLLLALQADSAAAQAQFAGASGLSKVCSMLKQSDNDVELRAKSAQFLAVLFHAVLPQPPPKAAIRELDMLVGHKASSTLREAKVELHGGREAAMELYQVVAEFLN